MFRALRPIQRILRIIRRLRDENRMAIFRGLVRRAVGEVASVDEETVAGGLAVQIPHVDAYGLFVVHGAAAELSDERT